MYDFLRQPETPFMLALPATIPFAGDPFMVADDALAADALLGGSIRNANPTRSTMNCANCVIAVDAILSGRPASAMPGGPTTVAEMAAAMGGNGFTQVAGQAAIESQLLTAGSGARGVVFGWNGPPSVGHFFNAVNQSGTVRFLDGQTQGAASFSGFKYWYFMPYVPR